MSINSVVLLGNVGRDPEIKTFQNGDKIANFSVATSERWKDKTSGEWKDKVQWHRVVVRNKHTVEIVEKYVRKGSKIGIEGMIEYREFEKDGAKQYITEIVVGPFNGKLSLESEKRDGDAAPRQDERPRREAPYGGVPQGNNSGRTSDYLDDDVPF